MNAIKLMPIVMLLILASTECYAGDGTWPLRLKGDGTWPLRFDGQSLSLQNPSSDALTTSLLIESLNEQPLDDGAATAVIGCTQSGEKYAASGKVTIGSTTFNIRGICYYGTNDTIEVISDLKIRQGNRTITSESRMTGQVPESEESSDSFSGRLRVGENTAEQGRYKFNVIKTVQLGRDGLLVRQ